MACTPGSTTCSSATPKLTARFHLLSQQSRLANSPSLRGCKQFSLEILHRLAFRFPLSVRGEGVRGEVDLQSNQRTMRQFSSEPLSSAYSFTGSGLAPYASFSGLVP